MLASHDLGQAADDALAAHAMHLLAEAQKLAYADRDRYVADPAFVAVPLGGLLDAGYLARRARLIDRERAMERPAPGVPPDVARRAFGVDATRENVGTSHLSIVDGDGNAVAMTTTIEAAFGSRIMAGGFLLNNELTDFSFEPVDATGAPIANRVQPGKRPRSSMAPTIVYDGAGQVFAVLGSPGGSRIPLYVMKALVAILDWQLDAQAATALINFGSRGHGLDIEITPSALWHGLKMKAYGHDLEPDLMNSGLHIIVRRKGLLEGGADPRREGVAVGD
jgi:gamma-glutamyltranspeptidase/glutathione hydrolase